MLLPYYAYFYGDFSLINRYYLIKGSTQCKNCEINILKIEIFLIMTNKNKSDKNKFYLLFAGLKNYLCNKRTHIGEKKMPYFLSGRKGVSTWPMRS